MSRGETLPYADSIWRLKGGKAAEVNVTNWAREKSGARAMADEA